MSRSLVIIRKRLKAMREKASSLNVMLRDDAVATEPRLETAVDFSEGSADKQVLPLGPQGR